ncbi:MAG: hypothetical protein WAM14_00940, partial [Candidatus Nitrosopolaris sp.]
MRELSRFIIDNIITWNRIIHISAGIVMNFIFFLACSSKVCERRCGKYGSYMKKTYLAELEIKFFKAAYCMPGKSLLHRVKKNPTATIM